MSSITQTEPALATEAGIGEWRRRWRRFRRNRLALSGLVLCVVLVVVAVLAPMIAPYPYAQNDYDVLMAPTFSHGHLLGTDALGRDVLSRLIYSLRTGLVVAVGAELTALVFAGAVGLAAGYLGGKVDQLLMAVTDVMFAFPTYLFSIVLVAVLGPSWWSLMIAIGIASWVSQARLFRAQMIKLKSLEYVEAGRAMGAPGLMLSTRYILPNMLGPVLVATSFGIPHAILAESGLALLGLGVPPPTPSWGGMIVDGYGSVLTSPHLIVWPLALFALTMLAFTLIGDGVRDALDTNTE